MQNHLVGNIFVMFSNGPTSKSKGYIAIKATIFGRRSLGAVFLSIDSSRRISRKGGPKKRFCLDMCWDIPLEVPRNLVNGLVNCS